ncbi:MAG TPA: cytochrome c [Alphaproteobacteria bacterium]|nr:cytochrome c [Alphaproteobacteria bacterium]
MGRFARTLSIAAALLFLAFAVVALVESVSGAEVGDAARGAALAERWCASCHAMPGQSQASDTAPSIDALAHDPKTTPDFLRGFLAQPHKPMPPLSLSRAQIEDLVAYFGTRAGR